MVLPGLPHGVRPDACGPRARASALSRVARRGASTRCVRTARGFLRNANARELTDDWCVCVSQQRTGTHALERWRRSGGGDRVGISPPQRRSTVRRAHRAVDPPHAHRSSDRRCEDGATASPGGAAKPSAWPSGLGMSAEGMTPRPGSAGVSFLGSPARLPGMADPTTEESAGGGCARSVETLSLSLGGSPARCRSRDARPRGRGARAAAKRQPRRVVRLAGR